MEPLSSREIDVLHFHDAPNPPRASSVTVPTRIGKNGTLETDVKNRGVEN